MPTIIGILTFMSRKNSILRLYELEKLTFLIFYTYEYLKCIEVVLMRGSNICFLGIIKVNQYTFREVTLSFLVLIFF